MVSGFQIACANKTVHGVITRVGGPGWSLSVREAVTKISLQQLRLYIRLGDEFFDVGVRGEGADAFLALEPEGTPLHEVEGLPSC